MQRFSSYPDYNQWRSHVSKYNERLFKSCDYLVDNYISDDSVFNSIL